MPAKISRALLDNVAARVMRDAGYDYRKQGEPTYTRNEAGTLRADVGACFLSKGAMKGWYIAQHANEGGAERNLCGAWDVLTASEMMAFLKGVELMNRKAEASIKPEHACILREAGML
jgi:hypothetical protein